MDIYILTLTLVILSKGFTKGCDTVSDPCLDENHDILPNPDGRCPACDAGDECDKFTMSEHTWYRTDTTMTATCVHPGACGNNETDAGDINDVVGCLSTFGDCCSYTFPLKTKYCNGYHVHCFLELPNGCPQRFCFDSPSETNITANTTTESSITPTATSPNKPTSKVSSLQMTTTPLADSPSETNITVITTTESSIPSTATTPTKPTSKVPSLQMTTTPLADCLPVYQEPCSCPIAMVVAISVTGTALVAAVFGIVIFRRCFSPRKKLAPTHTQITKQVPNEDYLTPSDVKTMNEYDYITAENSKW